MKRFYRIICGGIGLLLTLSVATEAKAWFVFDVMRTAQFSMQGVQRLLNIISEYEKSFIKKQEVLMRKIKSAVSEADLPTGDLYEFLDGANIMKMGSEQYLPSTANAAQASQNIREKFFYPADMSKLTEEVKEKVLRRRYAYMEALTKEVLSLSAAVKEQVAKEQEKLAASATAGSGVQQVELLAQTKKIMVEQQAASILLQAKLYELEAARTLMNLSPQLIEQTTE